MFHSLNLGLYQKFLSSRNKDTLTLYKEISRQYHDNDILTYVNHLIPKNVLTQFNTQNQTCQPLKTLLQWFKKDFMKWMPKDLQCNLCKTQMKLQLLPGNGWRVRKIEDYECIKCGSRCIFPRYGEIKKIADTRIGRCSEWSMLFGAILNSLSFPTRIVHDYLDHCWNETLIENKWIHIDSTLEYPISLDHPFYYEQNWAKKYEYIIAFSLNGIEDVTRFYTTKWDSEVQIRRNKNNASSQVNLLAELYWKI